MPRQRAGENRLQQRQRVRRVSQRNGGLQYDEAGRPLYPGSSGLMARIQRLLIR